MHKENTLNVGKAFKIYIEASKSMRSSEHLFIIASGTRKETGIKRSHCFIDCLKQSLLFIVEQAYMYQRVSTLTELATWQHLGKQWGMATKNICTATSWCSRHTSISDYCITVEPGAVTCFFWTWSSRLYIKNFCTHPLCSI